MRLLYAEDEPAMAEAVADYLTFYKYTVDTVPDGETALDYARTGEYDGMILDVMMPGKSGFQVLSELRRSGNRTPVLLLTAKGGVEDRIEGLNRGADDYLPKPFDMGELLARVKAMLRRREDYRPDVIAFGDLTLNPSSFELSAGGRTYVLPNLEYRLCETLMSNHGIYLSGESLLVKVWGYETDSDLNTVRVYISGLRKKLAALGSRVSIESKRNVGYTLKAE